MSTNARTETTHGCSASHSSAAEVIGSNQDLLVQILARLPSKSLLKFKCVSKEWQSLISTPRFARCCKPHCNSPCALLVRKLSTDDIAHEFVSLDPTHSDAPFKSLTFIDDPRLRIVDSSIGLLLCESKKRYYVYNPTTKQHTQLPPLRLHYVVKGLYLAFDPLKSPYYKVICVFKIGSVMLHNKLHGDYEFDVYSSELRHWKTCDTLFRTSASIFFSCGVFWNGSIHWLSCIRSKDSMYFNIEQEQPHVMPLPLIPESDLGLEMPYFGVSRDHMHVVATRIEHLHSLQLDVYEMSKDYSGWIVKYRVNLDALLSVLPETFRDGSDPLYLFEDIRYKLEVLCISRGETDEDFFLVLQTPHKIIRYDIRDGANFKKICDFDDAADEEGLRLPPWLEGGCVYQYFDSLASV